MGIFDSLMEKVKRAVEKFTKKNNDSSNDKEKVFVIPAAAGIHCRVLKKRFVQQTSTCVGQNNDWIAALRSR